MAQGYATALRNAKLDANATFIGNGAKLRIYDGTRPATGAAIGAQVKLVEYTLGSPFAAAASGGVQSPTLPAIVAALATGTATWYRIVKADGTTFCIDGGVGDGLTLSSASITSGVDVEVTGWTITGGNA